MVLSHNVYTQSGLKINSDLIAYHGYFLGGEYLSVDKDFLTDFLSDYDIPTLALNPMMYQGRMSFHLGKLYTHLGVGYTLGEEAKDSLYTSTLNQFFISPGVGINIFANDVVLVSAYTSFRYSRFRQVSSTPNRQLSISEYFFSSETDLRLNNFSAALGLNAVFEIDPLYSCGLYIAYSFNFHGQAILNTIQNSISPTPKNPFGNLNIGIGFGFGFIEPGRSDKGDKEGF